MGSPLQPLERLIALSVLLVGLLTVSHGFAQPENARYKALTHFRQAQAYMKAEAYEAAVKEYQAAYEAVPKAGFLFNIGLAYEKAGEKRKAVENFRRYLELEPNGKVAEEAQARAVALEALIEKEDAAAAEAEREKREAERRKLVAESHAGVARTHIEAKQYDQAIAALRAAYAEDPNPDYVFQLAEVYRVAGDRQRAVIEYELYRELAPEGPHAADALRQAATLNRELEAAAQAPPPTPPPPAKPVPAKPGPDVAEQEEDEGVNWWWFSAGAALVVAGVIVDWAPDNARNNTLEGTDVLPLVLYGTGGAFMLVGVW